MTGRDAFCQFVNTLCNGPRPPPSECFASPDEGGVRFHQRRRRSTKGRATSAGNTSVLAHGPPPLLEGVGGTWVGGSAAGGVTPAVGFGAPVAAAMAVAGTGVLALSVGTSLVGARLVGATTMGAAGF